MRAAILFAITTFFPTVLFAFAPVAYSPDNALHSDAGELVRSHEISFQESQLPTWQAFLERYGNWRAMWSGATGTPIRVCGEGIAVVGSVQSAQVALDFSRRFLGEHRELLGIQQPSTFTVLANKVSNGIRTVSFQQVVNGLPVVDGHLHFAFKHDRLFVFGSHVWDVSGVGLGDISAAAAQDVAQQWVHNRFQTQAMHVRTEAPAILPLAWVDRPATFSVVRNVVVRTQRPIGEWHVYVDGDQNVVAYRQHLRFATGTIAFDVPVRRPTSTRADVPAALARVEVDGVLSSTELDGSVSWSTEDSVSVTVEASGDDVVVENSNGSEIEETFVLAPDETFVWSRADDELDDAQLTTFIATHQVKDYVRGIAPGLEFLADPMEAFVNRDETFCNAFSDGITINFFQAGGGCENSGRLPDVVFHEFGHAFHLQSIIPGVGDFDGSLSEGAADYLSATMNDDPGMGRGFFFDDGALRHLDPPDNARWPDDIHEDPHITGLIFGGAMWDLRKRLVATHGEQGVTITDTLLYEVLQRARNIPTSYIEILAADDDDGNLANGTPNFCAINTSFLEHGLGDPQTLFPAELPQRDGLAVSLQSGAALCPEYGVQSAKLFWRDRGQPGSGGDTDLAATDFLYTATLPEPEPGSMIEYRIEVTLQNGELIRFPKNLASPWYDMFWGSTEVLYCTDFETDPFGEEWVSELLAGENTEGANDWQWGVSRGEPRSGDPDETLSGNRVVGNDLGGGNYNGRYQSDKINALTSPRIATLGYQRVLLRYRRWLNVEDGIYDQANIYAGDELVWTNAKGGGSFHHLDQQWREHVVDLSAGIEQASVQVRFEINSDGGLEMGGWTIDDLCVVAFTGGAPNCTNCDNRKPPSAAQSADADKKDSGCAAAGAIHAWWWALMVWVALRRSRRFWSRRTRVSKQ